METKPMKITPDTATKEGQEKRLEQLVDYYIKTGNKKALVRLIGGSVEDWGQKTGAEHGEPPKGAEWN